ncbi:MAG: NAD-dependent deacylase, partial [bacterium]
MTPAKLNFDLKKNHRITFLTGAGVSAESGIPTFRGVKGLWEKVDVQKLATPEGFEEDPKLVWEWYNTRRQSMGECSPNNAHNTCVKLEKSGYDVQVVTQNIDGLHNLSGSENVLELHGNIWKVRCTRNCGVWIDRTVPFPDLPPLCACGSYLRPHVVWFGEMLDEKILATAFMRISNTDLCIVAGTSGIVYPAAGMAEMARNEGAYVIEINLEATPLSQVAHQSFFG